VSGLDDGAFDAVRAALLEYHVVFVPAQFLGPADLLAVGSRFGTIDVNPLSPKVEGFPAVTELVTHDGRRRGRRRGRVPGVAGLELHQRRRHRLQRRPPLVAARVGRALERAFVAPGDPLSETHGALEQRFRRHGESA
jgi:hypothetical protein